MKGELSVSQIVAGQAQSFVIGVIRESWHGGLVRQAAPLKDYGFDTPRAVNNLKARINEKRWHGVIVGTAVAQGWAKVQDVIDSVVAAAH